MAGSSSGDTPNQPRDDGLLVYAGPKFRDFYDSLGKDDQAKLTTLAYSLLADPSVDGIWKHDLDNPAFPDARYLQEGRWRIDYQAFPDGRIKLYSARFV